VNATLGHLEYMRKNYQRSAGLLLGAVAADQSHLPSRRFLGLSQYRLKQYEAAAPNLAFVVEQEPGDRDTMFALARCYSESGNSTRALRIYTHLRADPRLGAHASLSSGTLHAKAEHYTEAITDFQVGLKHDQVPAKVALELHYQLAAAHLKEADVSAAMADWESIRAVAAEYRDVPDLIKRYREISANRYLQVFLVGGVPDFISLCRQLALGYFPDSNTKLGNVEVSRQDYVDVIADVSTARFDDQILFRFLRTGADTGELVLREMYAKLKEMRSGGRGICVSAGSFTSGAQSFVEARRIDLIGKEQLLKKFERLRVPATA
jgi:tetratricopeptide (TPR) repeat protein